jgi:multidrug resistance efflux pump
MQKRKIIAAILAVAVLAIAGIVGYYAYQGAHYVATDDARIASNVVAVTPEIPGKLLEWKVREGDRVEAGEILGRQDLGTALSSGSISPQSMGGIAAVYAEKASIKSPIAGQVILSNAVVGQSAAPGTALAVIADTEGLYVSANVKEVDIAKVRLGQSVRIEVDAYPRRSFSGRVESVGRATASTFSLLAAQSGGGNYTKVVQVIPVKVSIEEQSDARLMIGMNANVRVDIAGRAEER